MYKCHTLKEKKEIIHLYKSCSSMVEWMKRYDMEHLMIKEEQT